jgi:hypothetical protein
MQATKPGTSRPPATVVDRPRQPRKRSVRAKRKPSDRVLRERVAYMLWVMAQQVE